MKDIEQLLEEINKQQEYMNILLISLKEDYFKNKDVPLDERWKIFEQVANKGIYKGTQLYGDGFISILSENDELTLYDHFYVEKYQTEHYTNMYSKILDIAEEENITQEMIDEWREAVLESGDTAFIYDW